MDTSHRDILQEILKWLTFRDFIAVSLTNCQFAVAAAKYAKETLGLAYTTTLQRDLIVTYTCPCGCAEWDIVKWCDCWRECCWCGRQQPGLLLSGNMGYCKYMCIPHCIYCCKYLLIEDIATSFSALGGFFNCESLTPRAVCGECEQDHLIIGRRRFAAGLGSMCFEYLLIEVRQGLRPQPTIYRAAYDSEYIAAVKDIIAKHDPANPWLAVLF